MKALRMTSIALLAGLLLAACAENAAESLTASGVVEAVELAVAPEIGGRVVEVLVEEGDSVDGGQPLLRLNSDQLTAQRQQAVIALQAAEASLAAAQAGQATAEAALETAETAMQSAELQVHMTLALARSQQAPARVESWSRAAPSEFDLPGWYFAQSEQIEAAQAEVAAAEEAWQREREGLAAVIAETGGDELNDVAGRLLQAQTAFAVIDQLTDLQIAGVDRRWVRDYIDDLHEAAEAELESAQQEYDNLMSDAAADDLLEARARSAVAHEWLLTAQAELDSLRAGEHSLEAQLAFVGLQQAEAQHAQAEAGLSQAEAQLGVAESAVDQARAALQLVEIQLDNLTVVAPSSGVVMTRLIEPGELMQPGMPALTIGQLDDLHITVYLPEDRYGQVSLGDTAAVTVDSYPDESFAARVTRIADRAEFTPRNVQTEEDRRSTVYAVVLSVQDAEDKLKPGMPADVEFES